MNLNTDSTNIFALYLPQFYETPYNNEWWGTGYTEWVACKKAKPLYKGHCQPKVPLNDNYYDLSEKENIKWQIDLAKSAGIDGFAIYQYYSVGSKLLQVPTELIRDNKELNIPFYLYWANTSWQKLWFGQDKRVIWEQKYGGEKEWKEQFEYCLTFFKDERYICIDNKPVYAVYQPSEFKEIESFIACWNRWAVEEGFSGIYFVKTLGTWDKEELGGFSAVVTREPNYTFAHSEPFFEKLIRVPKMRMISWINNHILEKSDKKFIMLKYSYDKMWKRIISRTYKNYPVFLGAFTDFDNSPRRGYNSIIMTGATPAKFKEYMQKLVAKSKIIKSPMIVVNAWNEWAEGSYLEPDTMYRDLYLKAIKSVKNSDK